MGTASLCQADQRAGVDSSFAIPARNQKQLLERCQRQLIWKSGTAQFSRRGFRNARWRQLSGRTEPDRPSCRIGALYIARRTPGPYGRWLASQWAHWRPWKCVGEMGGGGVPPGIVIVHKYGDIGFQYVAVQRGRLDGGLWKIAIPLAWKFVSLFSGTS